MNATQTYEAQAQARLQVVALRRAIILLVDAARCSLAEPFSGAARVRLKAQIAAALRDLDAYEVAALPSEIPAVPVAETFAAAPSFPQGIS